MNKNPDKRTRSRAHGAVSVALLNGTLRMPEGCSNCGRICKLDGHHEDYDKPLDVIWLCKSCHKLLHRGKLLELESRRLEYKLTGKPRKRNRYETLYWGESL